MAAVDVVNIIPVENSLHSIVPRLCQKPDANETLIYRCLVKRLSALKTPSSISYEAPMLGRRQLTLSNS